MLVRLELRLTSGAISMSDKETATLPRQSKLFFQKAEKTVPASEGPVMALDMGEASREEGFRLNGCR